MEMTRDERTMTPYARAADTFGEMLENIATIEQMKATLDAWEARMIDAARRFRGTMTDEGPRDTLSWSPEIVAQRELSSELACLLRISERGAENLVGRSRALVEHLPATLTALEAGTISARHATAMVDESVGVPDEHLEEFEALILERAPEQSVARMRDRARRLREKLGEHTLTERAVAARDGRWVSHEAQPDSMAWLGALLPAEVASAAYERITAAAEAARSKDDPRTLSQLRADIFADLLIEGEVPSVRQGIRAKVFVTVPVLTLLGDDAPGTLEGYGPIDAETARVLAAGAPSFVRILTHPETGVVLSVGRDSYAVPADLKNWLRVRDETCRFPNCTRPVAHTDADHTRDYALGGETRDDNLAHLCRRDHNLKHHTRWRVRQLEHGVLEWTSPAGRIYVTRPANGPGAG